MPHYQMEKKYNMEKYNMEYLQEPYQVIILDTRTEVFALTRLFFLFCKKITVPCWSLSGVKQRSVYYIESPLKKRCKWEKYLPMKMEKKI